LITEQSELLRRLSDVVRETEQFRSAEAQGKLVRLPTGDGMALVFRNNPEAPVKCALELSKKLKAHPELSVRMGIHSGPVNEVPEKFRQTKETQIAPATPASDAKPARRTRTWIAALVIVAASAAAGTYIFSHRSSSKAILEKSIAVLPFENLSRDPDNAYFADGIQDEILTRLSKIADLKVISRTSTQHYKSAPENLPEIANQLGV